jgi:hypothetical protein
VLVRAVSTACRSSERETFADVGRRPEIPSQASCKRTADQGRASRYRNIADGCDADWICPSRAGEHSCVDTKQSEATASEGGSMMDPTKGLRTLLAALEAHKSRGWAAHNEMDYFTLCPTCGHWFDCRNPESLVRHTHPTTVRIVATVTQRSSAPVCEPIIERQNPRSNAAIETSDHLPDPPAGSAKS